MELLFAFCGFLLIALLWAFVIFDVFRHGFKIKKKSFIYFLFLFIGIGAVIVLMGVIIEYTESPEFCGNTCHPYAGVVVHDAPMEPYLDQYNDPGNNEIMETHVEQETTCSNCHDKPGATGKIEAYISAIGEIITYITGDYDKDHLEAHFSDDRCLKCHDGKVADEAGDVLSVNNTEVNPHEDSHLKCAECHKPHQKGMGLSLEACVVCHDVEETQLKKHEVTTKLECMNCHDNDHPEEAKISFSSPELQNVINNEFCSDCHFEPYESVINWTETDKSIYGNNCIACHNEHQQSKTPHITSEPYQENCDQCHVTGVASHSLKDISFLELTFDISNEFCLDCHQTEYNAYMAWDNSFTSFYGNCTTSCHIDNRIKDAPHNATLQYENCSGCHIKDFDFKLHIPSKVTLLEFSSDVDSKFCSDCHDIEYNSLENGMHSGKDCSGCHGEHKTIRVKFEECGFCHPNIPDSHNVNKTGCSSCHTMAVIHDTKFGKS